MNAIAVHRGRGLPTRIERPRPTPGAGEALVRTLRVGVDGTDHDVATGTHGDFPPGDDHLILGHEAVGVVETVPDSAPFAVGDTVVPVVRRPPATGRNEYFDRGEPDMAPPDRCVERGINGAHGFMAEYFTSPVEALVSIPHDLAQYGFLVEPLSVTAKALELGNASRSTFAWRPSSTLVLGNESLGLLTLADLRNRGYDRLYCLDRRDRPDPTIDLIDDLGATYVDSRETPVDVVPDVYEAPDLVYGATGHGKHAFQAMTALAPNGVVTMLGLPDPWVFDVDGGNIHKDLVMPNKAVVGSVNANHRHFGEAVDRLADLPPAGFWMTASREYTDSTTSPARFRAWISPTARGDGTTKRQ